jgi:Ca2+-binding RTX toxin-like protein
LPTTATPWGDNIDVATYPGGTSSNFTDAAAWINGGFVTAWYDNSSFSNAIRIRRYDAFGQALDAPPIEAWVNAQLWDLSVATLPNGNIFVAWTEGFFPNQDVRYAVFDFTGAVLIPSSPLAQQTNGWQSNVQLAQVGAANIMAFWYDGDQNSGDLISRVINANGSLPPGLVTINTNLLGLQNSPALASLAGNGALFVWQDGTGLFFRTIFGNYSTVSSVSGISQGFASNPDAAGFSDGRFVIAYTGGTFGANDAYVRVFNANRTAASLDILVNETGDATKVHVATLPDGGFVVNWTDAAGLQFGQVFSAANVKIGGPFAMGAGPAGDLVTLADGRMVSIWKNGANEFDAQIIDARTAHAAPTAASDTIAGLNVADIIVAGNGADSVHGAGGDDTLFGQAGDDTLFGGEGNDVLVDYEGCNVLYGNDGDDTLVGGAGDDKDALFGGGGYDSALYYYVIQSAATITHNADGSKTITIGGVTDTLRGVEVAVFDGGTRVSLQERTDRSDLAGDGRSDILLQNAADGSVFVWEVNGVSLTGSGYVGWTPGAVWKAKGTGDFNGDGKSDVLLQNADTGQNFLWLADGLNPVSAASGTAGWAAGAVWKTRATGDFNGDGKSDILMQNADDGACYIWNLDGTNIISHGQAGWTPGADWKVRGTGDFNGDGRSDILLQNAVTGQNFTFMVNGTTAINSGLIGTAVGANWVAKGAGDFNGDGKSDILFQEAGSGAAYVWNLDGTTVGANGYVGWTPGVQWEALA